eukprot:350203-Chlamydomonas_euryale.AAC.4
MCTGPPPAEGAGDSGCGDDSGRTDDGAFLIDVTATVHEQMATWWVRTRSCTAYTVVRPRIALHCMACLGACARLCGLSGGVRQTVWPVWGRAPDCVACQRACATLHGLSSSMRNTAWRVHAYT